MTDYITRQAAIDRIDRAIDLHEMDGIVSGVLLAVRKSIEEVHAADVVEVGERYYFKDGYRYEISTEGWLKVCRPERADICRIFRSLR